ncbi:MAG: cadherin-like domain-containing protein [DPANN group archaeon]|nr:cadherin-like domain-containing protein [DPANN group archaeon]
MILFIVTFFLFCSALFATSFAFPQQPTHFYGYVYLGADNNSATTGTNITAKINNIIFSSTLTIDGNLYSFLVPTDDSETETKEGATTGNNISLFVIDIYSNSWIFTGPGASNRLDLYINRPPVLDTISDISITENDTATITPHATDIDGDSITYSINDTDRFKWSSSSFTWITDYDDAGVYTVRVTATDSAMSDYQDVTVTVANKNRAPVAADGSTTTYEDTSKDITLSATDADGDSLTYALVTAPTHGTVSISGATATYTPNANYNGADSFTFNANDGTVNSTAKTISITVTAVNDAPILTTISDISVFERQKITVKPIATDVDLDSLTFTANNSNLIWNTTSSVFEWTPDYLDSGNYTIIVTVSDTVLEDSTTFNIEVKDKYHAFDRDLALGWNLISFPYVLDSASIDDVLSTVTGNYNVVWAYNISADVEWTTYNPTMPFEGNTLKTLENVQGFWVNMTSADRLTVIGTIPTSTTINLNQGWNLISYPFNESADISCMLSQVAGNYTVVWQYNETAPGADYEKWTLNNPAAPVQVNTLDNFTKGYGYWINMTEIETLEWTSTC